MSDTPGPAQVRLSTAELNQQIRALWARAGSAGRRLTAEERTEYELLVVRWAAAERGEIVKAA